MRHGVLKPVMNEAAAARLNVGAGNGMTVDAWINPGTLQGRRVFIGVEVMGLFIVVNIARFSRDSRIVRALGNLYIGSVG